MFIAHVTPMSLLGILQGAQVFDEPCVAVSPTSHVPFSAVAWVAAQIDLVKGMLDCLYAECTPCITGCVMAELEKLGQKYRVALRIAKVSAAIQGVTLFHSNKHPSDRGNSPTCSPSVCKHLQLPVQPHSKSLSLKIARLQLLAVLVLTWTSDLMSAVCCAAVVVWPAGPPH